MSVKFVTVQWNKKKIIYDIILVISIVIYTQLFILLGGAFLSGPRAISYPILEMRAWGTCAFLMLNLILAIGPLARISRRFLPILYNRRHFGVIFFFVALMHARAVLGFYHAFGRVPGWESLLTYDVGVTSSSYPFQIFGLIALVIFFLMAATSHDFWQAFLGPTVWKGLHMLVYLAYALVVAHVALGALQWETHPAYAALVGLSVLLLGALHLLAARRSNAQDGAPIRWVEEEGRRWIDAGDPARIPRDRAVAVCPPGAERIALIRHGEDQVSAIHGVCAHQGGPLYEGKVIDGCLTCPWHGWQYRPADGQSPPPFQERLPTYRLRLSKEGRVLVDPEPLPPGTPTPPIRVGRPREPHETGAETEAEDG